MDRCDIVFDCNGFDCIPGGASIQEGERRLAGLLLGGLDEGLIDMDISRKTDYALRMLAMLVQGEGNLLSVRTAAEEVDVPYSFARSIQHGLVRAGIVESLRGVHGGMRLKVDPAEVTIRQIVEAVQGPLVMNDCTADDVVCPRSSGCCYHPIWSGAQALMHSYLDSVTLDDVVNRRQNPAVDAKFADRARFAEYAVCGERCTPALS